jgi:hypothetical protein
MVGTAVAKKKAQRSGERAPEGRTDYIRARVTPAFKEWAQRFADHERSDISDLLDNALAHYARARKFDPPPKR